MINIFDNESGTLLGSITETQLKFLVDAFEEESANDKDYFIDEFTIDLLKTDGADEDLINFLTKALAGKEGLEIRWEKA